MSGGLVFWPFTARSRTQRVSDAIALYRKGQEQLKIASREVAESERIIAQWSTLIDAMRADGRDVTVASDLLKTFKDNLDVRHSNRDLIEQRFAENTGQR
jgi:bifunctional pyridoxal-dependent enzyme with beta-cystathionase and maltose regulon repressor activities